MSAQVETSVITGVECPECGEIFLPYEAPQARLPIHPPSGDETRTLDCGKSGKIGIEIFGDKPKARVLTVEDIVTAIY